MRKILVVLVAVIVVGGLSRSCSECVASDDTGALSPTVREKYNRELYQATLARDVACLGRLGAISERLLSSVISVANQMLRQIAMVKF